MDKQEFLDQQAVEQWPIDERMKQWQRYLFSQQLKGNSNTSYMEYVIAQAKRNEQR